MSELIQAQKKARPAVARILWNHQLDVEDILQEAAIRALEHEHQFRGDSAFSTWFTRIAIRSALMFLRKHQIRFRDTSVLVDEYDRLSPDENPEQIFIREEREELLHTAMYKAINRLSRTQRIAARRWLQGEKTLNNAEKAARHHARSRLREYLSPNAGYQQRRIG